jgi:hypothetical protein
MRDEELKVVLKCMGTTHSIFCRGHTNIAHISVGSGFWAFIDWESLAYLSEYYTPFAEWNWCYCFAILTIFLSLTIMNLYVCMYV